MWTDTLLSGDNAPWLDEQYARWLQDPTSVDPAWAQAFASLERPAANGALPGSGPGFRPRSIFNAVEVAVPQQKAEGTGHDAQLGARLASLIDAYRRRGHLAADIDPLGMRDREVGELAPSTHGLGDLAPDAPVPSLGVGGLPERTTFGALVERLRACYCGSLGVEFQDLADPAQRAFFRDTLEGDPEAVSPELERHILRKLADAESFERLLHARFPGTKRFSLEGAETLVPLLDLLLAEAARRGVAEAVIGMAHRGRLNTVVNVFKKPVAVVVNEFQDVWGASQGSGDVKYHLGYSSETVTFYGDRLHLSLTPNPSHLEAVDPVVEGRVRARQRRRGDHDRTQVLPVLVHGDAAFIGQGLVMEVFNLSELAGYRTGGTLHVVVNNQIGFTTAPREGRSGPYCTDAARMVHVPVLHVNGEDPRAVVRAVRLAAAYRQTWHRDVVIDMYCYRLHGHNEGDEPSFTQPRMYDAIRRRPTPRKVYADQLVQRGGLTAEEAESIAATSRSTLASEAEQAAAPRPLPARERAFQFKDDDQDQTLYREVNPQRVMRATRPPNLTPIKGLWAAHVDGDLRQDVATGVPKDRLSSLLLALSALPEGFGVHPKVKRLLQQRDEMARGERPLDWAMGELGAYACLLAEGHPVRLSGQDCGRGTFSHRHAVFTDVRTEAEVYPLAQLGAPFEVIDSSLSEAAVLGFEYGVSLDTPDGLTLWEAQFGDFVNGAQILIDQYLVSGETKWGRLSGLVLLLPHGYEGQGPEHSSGRMERFLQAFAEDNLEVANVTTPAQIFHLLRRQVLRRARKPLVVMAPKSLLRHPEATSTLDDLAHGAFQRVIGDGQVPDNGARRVVLCSGKLYYELANARKERGVTDVALVRCELLAPFPFPEVVRELARYPGAEVVWCQEEPRNMGAYPSLLDAWVQHLPERPLPRYVGRPAAASPATGSHKKHLKEQAAVIDGALSLR